MLGNFQLKYLFMKKAKKKPPPDSFRDRKQKDATMLRGLSTAEKRMLHFQLGYLLPPNRKFPAEWLTLLERGKVEISPAMVCVQV